MTTAYMAGRYGRRRELLAKSWQLGPLGFNISANWLLGEHEAADGNATAEDQMEWAEMDMEDILASDLFIAHTEAPDSVYGRGGRHVELGIAIAMKIPVVLIGPRENVFCHMEQVEQFDTWEGYLATLRAESGPIPFGVKALERKG
jgi:hypothetical protein